MVQRRNKKQNGNSLVPFIKIVLFSLLFLVLTFPILNCASREKIDKNRLLKLTFDGQGCVYKGPTVLTPGPVTLVFVNKSNLVAGTNLTMHLEGKTIQDMIDYIGEEPSSKRRPSWTRELGTMKAVNAGETFTWVGELEPGTYTLIGARLSNSLGVWFGTGLVVEE